MTKQPQAADRRLPVSKEALQTAYLNFRHPQYQRHNRRRQEHLATLGLDLRNKSVLELGAGVGDHTTFFLDRGCSVVSLEPRAENCRLFAQTMRQLRERGYGKAVNSTLVLGDVESMDKTIRKTFDIVYCYGLLYHLADPRPVMAAMAGRCSGLLLLETCVSFGEEEALNPVTEVRANPTQSFQGTGCRPTRIWVFRRLKKLFPFVYVPSTQPAHEEFPLNWAGPSRSGLLTRAIFVGSRHTITNSLLLDHLPQEQTAC